MGKNSRTIMTMKLINYTFIFALIFSAPILAEGRDMLTLSGDDPIEVFVSKESDTYVEYKDLRSGAVLKKNTDDVDRVIYSDASSNYKRAMSYIDSKDPRNALQRLLRAKKEMTTSRGNWHKHYISYYVGYVLYLTSPGNSKTQATAVKYLTRFVDGYPKSRFILNAKYCLAKLNVMMKKYPEAAELFKEIEKTAGKRVSMVSRSLAGRAELLRIEGKTEEAIKTCLALVDSGKASPELVSMIIQLLIDDEKDYKKAKEVASKLLKMKSSAIKSSAYELKASADLQLKQYESSLDAVLRSRVLYGDGTYSARSHFVLAVCLKALMAQKPDEYPKWEYETHYMGCLRSMSSAERKKESKFKI